MHNPATVLGFDFGTKKIGVAVGQAITRTASGLETIPYREQQPDWQRIEKLIKEWQPHALLVGIPYNMDDTEQPLTILANAFKHQLESRFQRPVHPVDERLTTRASWQLLKQYGAKSAYQKKRQKIDQVSATLIIETWFSTQEGV